MIFPDKLSDLKNESTVHLWLIDLKKPLILDMSIFHESELLRAERYRLLKPKLHFLTCRHVLRKLLAWYLGEDPKQIKFLYNENGKPFLDRGAHFSPLQFNVTHSENTGCIAISNTNKIGVDIEKVVLNDLLENQDIFLSLNEMENLASVEKDKSIALFHSWTQKEAYLKAIGTGFAKSPTSIESYITTLPNLKNRNMLDHKINSFLLGSNIISLCTEKDVEVEFYHFHSFDSENMTFKKN